MQNNVDTKGHFRYSIPVVIVLILILAMYLMAVNGMKISAYAVLIDGEEQFLVENHEEVEISINNICSEHEQKLGKIVEFDNTIEYESIFANEWDLLKGKEIEEKLKATLDFSTPAIAIIVDGDAIAYVENEAIAKSLLNKLKDENSKISEDERLVSSDFVEEVELVEKNVSTKKIKNEEQVYSLITTGTESPEKYIVEEGDSIWLIAHRNNLDVDDIKQVNKLNSETLSIGQELILVKNQPLISTMVQVEGEKIETISHETKTVTDNNLGSTVRVRQVGQDGKKQISYVATLVNGVVKEREIKEKNILRQPVDQVIARGNQVAQVASRGGSSGVLDWPVYGPITSYFGSRGGTHMGLDIGARTGTDIKAADSGVVIFAGYQGAYGYLVRIDHGNGMETRYAHCSRLLVSRGEHVSRGQVIARVGSTGRSTGPHLHFEVLTNGVQRNPLNYLR
ncbi:hypothetical protein SYNTR_2057 [Candidatus Syntrophocurvum alkaliphilum]|uniref:Uncharacterized protein n=1 Tax=Candidatus Syntrophocurvum alkaliphilum TaxID=2293317 RepID=A0A6I6DNF0_9FIRM|nr:peptidoglycan DD-metalloendopeptidase family protein [Candidatus Syntrophocurvum alkaliphilum]QGU00651.1 hypothetical protein SYNTR_2057 [Candidatus Syntrophocurvum alkaliphilum]